MTLRKDRQKLKKRKKRQALLKSQGGTGKMVMEKKKLLINLGADPETLKYERGGGFKIERR